MTLGDSAQTVRTFSAPDVAEYADLAGSAVQTDAVPEPLIGALFSFLLGTRLPGPGTKYLKQSLEFLAPAPLDVPLTAEVEIIRLRTDKHLVDLETTCRTPDGTLICRGRALVQVADLVGSGRN